MSHIDLNLIRTFITLYEARSVTLAAERLFVTQPSVSYGLARLRELFDVAHGASGGYRDIDGAYF